MFKTSSALCALFLLMFGAGTAWAGDRVEVTLLDGKKIRGELLSRDKGKVRVKVSKTETLILPAKIIASTRTLSKDPSKGVEPPPDPKTSKDPAPVQPPEGGYRSPEGASDTLGRVALETLGGTAGGVIGTAIGAGLSVGLVCGFDFGGACFGTQNEDRVNLAILFGGLVGYGAGSTLSVWGIGNLFEAKGSYMGSLIGFTSGSLVTFIVLTNTQDLTVLLLPALSTVIGYEISHFMTPLAPESSLRVNVVPRPEGAQLSVSFTF